MADTAIKPTSHWQRVKRPLFQRLENSSQFDAVVIGGGITGVTTAYLLKKAGKKVCLLERDRIAAVDTCSTTAHLTYVTDELLTELAKNFGNEQAALVWQAGARAIDVIESIVNDLDIDCQFRRVPGYLHESIVAKKDQSADLEQEAELAKKLGFPGVFQPNIPYFNRPGVMFPEQAKFHPLRYLMAVAAAIDGDGCRLFEHAEVSEVQDNPQRVIVDKFELKTEHVIIATHVPITGKTGLVNATLFQTKLYPYSSYVIGAKVPRNLIPDACFWDTTDPYYYLRVEPGPRNDYAIFGGCDHKTGQVSNTEERFEQLRQALQTIIPQAKPDRQWSGQVVETNDGLPYIGETAPQQFAATGYSGNGMTFGTIAAEMARDYVTHRENPWQELFSPNRKKLIGGTLHYLAENVDYPYYMVKDSLTPSAGDDPLEVEAGDGKILSINGQRVACSRNEDGQLSLVSAVCTHMGCLVNWNTAEKTWDCPCHGSRFQATGEVIAGPAESPLAEVSQDAEEAKTSREEDVHAESAR